MSEENKTDTLSDLEFIAKMKAELQEAFNSIMANKEGYYNETLLKTVCKSADAYSTLLDQERRLSRKTGPS
jgi:hypothetical protein